MSEFRLRRFEEHRVGSRDGKMLLSYPAPGSPSGKVYWYSNIRTWASCTISLASSFGMPLRRQALTS